MFGICRLFVFDFLKQSIWSKCACIVYVQYFVVFRTKIQKLNVLDMTCADEEQCSKSKVFDVVLKNGKVSN